MKFIAIVEHRGIRSKCFTSTYLSPFQWQRRRPSAQLYLVVQIDEEHIRILDFTRMMSREPVMAGKNIWTALLASISEDMLVTYDVQNVAIPRWISDGKHLTATPIRSKGYAAAKIVSAIHTPDVKINYSDSVKTYVENVYPLRRMAKDVLYDVQGHVNVRNTVPIVNGITMYPEVVGSRLKAVNGGLISRNCKDTGRGHILLDFSPLGDLKCIPLSTCAGTWDQFALPAGNSMLGKLVILVVNGRWYLPQEFTIMDDTVLSFNHNRLSMGLILGDGKQANWDYWKNTPQVRSSQTITDTIRDADGFVMIIDSKHIQLDITHPTYVINREKLKFPLHVGGLLWDTATRTFVDYTRVHYRDHSIMWAPRLTELVIPPQVDPQAMISGISHQNWRKFDYFNHSLRTRMVMLDLVGTKEK